MGKVVKTVAIAAGMIVIGIASGGTALPAFLAFNLGVSVAVTSAVGSALLGMGVSMLMGAAMGAFAKKPSAQMDTALDRLHITINPQALGKWVFGESAAATDIVYAEQFGSSKDRILYIIAAAAHQAYAFGNFYINDELISFSGDGATGAWANTLWWRYKTGAPGQTHIGNSFGGGTHSLPASFIGAGLAYYGVVFAAGKDKTKDGLPTRLTQRVKGAPVYDPRKDSTRGGSGTHRADDQTTWRYNDGGVDIGANWALVVLFYLLGWRSNGKLVFGVGVDPDDIDYDACMAAANVCDATIDGKPRYRIGGLLDTSQEHEQIISQLESAIGGKVGKFGGKYTIWAPHDDLTPTVTITEADLLRDAGVEFVPSGPIEHLYNTARGRYIEPAQLYQAIDYPEVVESTAVTEDGRERVLAHDFALVQDQSIAERVARYLVRRSRFTATWRFALGPKGLLFKPFSVATLNIQETHYEDVTVRIISMQYGMQGAVAIECIEEDSSIYNTSAALGTPVTQLDPASYDPATTVAVSGLTAADISITGSAGTAEDALKVSWTDPGGLVRHTQVQYKKSTDTDYIDVAAAAIDFTHALIVPVQPGTLYDVRARHITLAGVQGAWSGVQETAGSTHSQPWDSLSGTPPTTVQNALVPTTSGNLLRNSVFGVGSDGLWNWSIIWDADGIGCTLSRVASGAQYVLRAAWTSAAGADTNALSVGTHVSNFAVYGIPVVPGARMAVGCRLRATTGNGFYVYPFLRFFKADGTDSADKFPAHYSFSGVPNSADAVDETCWQYCTVPSDAAWAEVEIYVIKTSAGSTAAGSVDIDRPIVVRIPTTQTVPPDWTQGVDAVIGADVTANSAFGAGVLWNFNNSAEGWTLSNGTATPNTYHIALNATASDPHFDGPTISIYGGLYTKVRARVRRTAGSGWDGRCYYTTGGHGISESYKKVISDSTVTNQWVILEWDMTTLTAGGTDWTSNTITSIRLDFGVDGNDDFDVDWIAIGETANLPNEAGATQNRITTGSGAPSGGSSGDLYFRTSNSTWYSNIAGSWTAVSDVTAANTAAAIAGQGSLATVSPPTYAGNAAALSAGLLPGQSFLDSSDSNKLKTVVSAVGGTLSVALNRYSQTKTRSGAGSVTSDTYTATVTGGSGSYSYVWEQFYGSALSAISAPTSASTTFSFSLAVGETKNAKIRLTVMDTTNNVVVLVACGFTGVETS